MSFFTKTLIATLIVLVPATNTHSSNDSPADTITIPNSEYLLGLEYRCVKPIQAKQLW